MRARIIRALILGTMLAWITLLFVRSSGMDPARAYDTHDAFHRIRTLNAAIERDVLLLGSGLLQNYDPLNDKLLRLRKLLETIRDQVDTVIPQHPQLDRQLDAMASEFRQRTALVEDFKSFNGLMHNSVRYFVFYSNRLSELASTDLRYAPLSLTVGRLTTRLLEVSQTGRGERRALLEELRQQLEQLGAESDLPEAAAPLRSHSRILFDTLQKQHRILHQLAETDFPDLVDAAEGLFLASVSEQRYMQRTYRILLYVSALLLLLYLTWLIIKLQQKAREIRRNNSGLRQQARVLRELAGNAPLVQLLGRIRQLVEQRIPGARCHILLSDSDALPEGLAGEVAGTPVHDPKSPLFERRLLLEEAAGEQLPPELLATAYGSRVALWSEPVCDSEHLPLGCVAVTHAVPRLPSQDELDTLATAATLTALTLEQRIAEQELSEAKELAEVTLGSIGDGVITTDLAGRIRFMNAAAERLTGWTGRQAFGRPVSRIYQLIDEKTGEPVENLVERLLKDGDAAPDSSEYQDTVLVSGSGNRCWVEQTASPIRMPDHSIVGAVLVFHDVTDNRRLVHEILHQATHDELTGLANRREFEHALEQALHDTHNQQSTHSLCYLDLDQFKVVNDTCGHIAGDQLLRSLSSLLKNEIRSQDVLGRLGGDEFGLLLCNCDIEQAEAVAEHLRGIIKGFRFEWDGKLFDIGVSIGIVPVTSDAPGITELLSRADMACYAAKDQGRNRVHVYKEHDDEITRRESELHRASDISSALEQNRFFLERQAIQSLAMTGGSCKRHYEVLVRMLDNNGHTIPPGSFIPAAERYNLMGAIDRWVINESFAYLGWLLEQGNETDFDGLAINLSGNSLQDCKSQDYIRQQLAVHSIPAELICFEVTETAAIGNLASATRFINDLKTLGFRFALDDFGSGLSSFAYLKNLPVDYLKIDGSFVRDMASDDIDRAMVEAIHQVGQALGIRTIAEFVEDEETILLLREIGVDFAQGYCIHRPEPIVPHSERRGTAGAVS